MIQLQTAIDALLTAFSEVPKDNSASRRKADILSNFAERFSEEVLQRAGLNKEDRVFGHNLLAIAHPEFVNEASPPDSFGCLDLYNAPSTLDATVDPHIAHTFVYGNERVLEWNNKQGTIHRTLTYDETARLVVFWLAEKVLQILKKNEWDRVNRLPDLFDRLMRLDISEPLPTGESLKVKYSLPYNPGVLLMSFEEFYDSIQKQTGTIRTGNVLKNASFAYKFLYEFVAQENFWTIRRLGGSGDQTVSEVVEALAALGLRFRMEFPTEIRNWVEAKINLLNS